MTLREEILSRAKPCLTPSQKPCSILSLADRDALARAFALSKREVEISAIQAGVIPQRYLRNIGSLGPAGQVKLLEARVLLVGAGGLGGTIAGLLARVGVGSLVIADGDSFSEDNLNRQALALESNLGSRKVAVASAMIGRINAATEVRTFDGFAAGEQMASLVQGASVAIDALDNTSSRFLLEEACRGANVPLVHGAVAGFNGQVTVIYPGDPGFRAIYGQGRPVPEKGIELELGNLPGIVSAVASLQVQEAVKIITGIGRTLRNRLLFLDSMNCFVEIISLT